jgi:hypothetical protein
MRADEGRRLCQKAEVYLYDLVCPEGAAVPERMRRHVEACAACQERLRRLREILRASQDQPSSTGPRQDRTIETLAEQFQLLDQRVTCKDVRPFLPKLALAASQIRIATPVTVHVDHCPRCAADMAALRALDMTADQWQRLSGYFESGGVARRPEPPPAPAAEIACRDVSKADLFDAVVPGGAPQDERHRAVAAHVRVCRTCAARASTLGHTIEAILKREDSETATVYHAQSDADHDAPQTGAPYPYPIDVQVLSDKSVGGAGPRGGASVRSPEPEDFPVGASAGVLTAPRLFSGRHLARAAVVVNILVVFLMLLWTRIPTALGTDVGDLLKTLTKVRNVHLVTTSRTGAPIQELWIAYGSDRLVRKTGQQWVLYDLDRGRLRTVEPGFAPAQQAASGVGGGSARAEPGAGVSPPAKMTRTQWDGIKKLMNNCLPDHVALDTKLGPATDALGAPTVANLDVREAIWRFHAEALSLRRGWRVYLDPATELPQRTEFYQERPGAARGTTCWDVLTTTVFTYPTEQEMNRQIEAMFPAR